MSNHQKFINRKSKVGFKPMKRAREEGISKEGRRGINSDAGFGTTHLPSIRRATALYIQSQYFPAWNSQP